MKIRIYCRFSPRPKRKNDKTPEQPNEYDCYSNERQEQDIRAYCKAQGYNVQAVYGDTAVSGGVYDRTGLWDCINDLKRSEAILVRSWDRLSRDSMQFALIRAEIVKKGCQVLSSTEPESSQDTPVAKFIQTILVAMAELQKSQTQARTRARMRQHQRGGRRMSKILPYGWKLDPEDPARMVEDRDEQLHIEVIIMENYAGSSLRSIAKLMEKHGIKYRGSDKWHHSSIRSIINRAKENPTT